MVLFLGFSCFWLTGNTPSSDRWDTCNGKSVFVSVGVFFLVVLKVFEGGFRVFIRYFCMAYLPRVVKIRFSNIRFWVIFFLMCKKFFFRGFHVYISF